MARYKATVDTPHSPDEVFAYLSDFANAQEWDPGTVRSERLGEGPLGEGTEFRLLASFLARKTTLIYRIVEYDPPTAVTFRGENASAVSLDRITFEPSDGGTRVTYDADLTLKGWLRVAQRSFQPAPVAAYSSTRACISAFRSSIGSSRS
jgi:carbon monoxide dehydrogenase subunit G